MRKVIMMNDDPGKKQRKQEPDKTTPPPETREDSDWFEAIGPEDADDETIAENLRDYGFNQMDEDNFESDPVAPSDMPDWTENAVYGEDRPLMPDEERELPEEADEDDKVS